MLSKRQWYSASKHQWYSALKHPCRSVTSMVVMLLAVAWMVTCSPTCWAQKDSGFKAEDTKLLRLLIHSRQRTRFRGLQTFQNPQAKYQRLGTLMEAISKNVARLESDELPDITLTQMIALAASTRDPRVMANLERLLETENFGLLTWIVAVLGKNQSRGSIPAIAKLIERPEFQVSYGFRHSLVRSLRQMRDPDAIVALVRLREDLDGQLAADLDRYFSKLDDDERSAARGRLAELNAAPGLSDRLAGIDESSGSDVGVPMTPFRGSSYYGIPIVAKRVLFVLDHSGSMKAYQRGMTRLDHAKRELVDTIASLPEDHEFAILFYSVKNRWWKSELTVADESSKQEAYRFVRKIGYGDKTNTHAALLGALDCDQSLEAVYVLSDGRPTMGREIQPAAILREVLHQNHFRGLRFHTIGIDLDPTARQFLQQLSAETNGEFRSIE